MERRKTSRLRVVIWLMAGAVVSLLLVLGGALVIADRSRGPAGPGLTQILETKAHEHWQWTLQDRDLPEARARRLFVEFYGLMQPLADVGYEVSGHAPRPRQDFPSAMHVVPLWSSTDTIRPVVPGSFLQDVPPEEDASKGLLALARDRGLVEDFLDVGRFRGALRDPSGRDDNRYVFRGEETAIATLLGAVYIDAIETGDEEMAARAAQAFIDAAVVLAEIDPGNVSRATLLIQTRSWLLRHSIELGRMTPSLARLVLDGTEPVDSGPLRFASVRGRVYEQLIWIAESERPHWRSDPLYGDDGRIKFMPALLSVFRSVPGTEYSPFAIPRIGFEKRHATLEEVADYLDVYAEASKPYFISSRADRRADMLPATLPHGASGTAYPVGLEAFWARVAPHRDMLDEIELLQNATTVALAIEVYRGEHGEPPASLDDLAPGVLATLPPNPWNNGGAWRYQLNARSPLGYKLTVPDVVGPHAEGVLPGEWPFQPRSLLLHNSEFYLMPSTPYDYGP